MIPRLAAAGECPSPSSEIATDRPDVTNSSQVVPVGSLQGENGINSTGNGIEKTFDGTNSRLRLGVAPCFELLVDLPNYVGRFAGLADSGFYQRRSGDEVSAHSLPESWNLSVTAGAGLPTGATRITGPGVQPYLQFPWSHELGNGWGTSGMLTTFFFPSDPLNHRDHGSDLRDREEDQRTGIAVRRICRRLSLRGSNVELFNIGGEYLLTRTQQVDFHVAFGLNRNSPDYIVGVGYSWRFDNLFAASTR